MNPTSELLNELFHRLNKSKITYCVLRNYEKLPERVGHDVDIWVSSSNEKMFQEILVNTARDVGWEIVRYAPWLNNRGQGRYFFIKNNDQLTTIHFDCYVPIYSKGINYIEEKTLSKNLFFFEKGFYVPVYGVEASILLFKDLFHDEKIKEKYRKRISECLEKDSKGFLETVKLMVGNENAKTITDMAKSGNWKQIEKMRSLLRRLLLKRGLLTGPFSQLYQLWRYIYTRLKEHFFEDLGIFIVLIKVK